MVRLVGAIVLLFLQPFSVVFFVVYTICGISDALDGAVARATGQSSEHGARLDSIADLTFYGVMLLKILPRLLEEVPVPVWCGIAGVFLVRFVSYGTAAWKYHQFASLHTYANKVAGAAMFVLPYLMQLADTGIVCGGICIISAYAALEECLIHLTSKTYDPARKTFWMKAK